MEMEQNCCLPASLEQKLACQGEDKLCLFIPTRSPALPETCAPKLYFLLALHHEPHWGGLLGLNPECFHVFRQVSGLFICFKLHIVLKAL